MMFSKNILFLSILSLTTTTLINCGGGSTAGTVDPAVDYVSSYDDLSCVAGQDTVGVWKTVANNNTAIPNDPSYFFFSYNQPSISRIMNLANLACKSG